MRIVLLSVLAGIAACDSGTAPTMQCDLVLHQAIALHITDSRTSQFAALGSMVTATVTSGPTATVVGGVSSDTAAVIIDGAAGTYSVTVSKNGYASTTKSGIVVPAQNQCGDPSRTDVVVSISPL